MGNRLRFLRHLLSRKLKTHVVVAGPLRGYRLVTSWHDYPAGLTGRTERLLLEWFQQEVRAGETWIDIGAHYGYTALALSRLVGATGRVFAFEPVIATAGCVAQTRRLNALTQLSVLPLGLGAPESFTRHMLPVTRGMADKTLDASGTAWLEAVQIARFDWLWPRINSGEDIIHGVKIDVQGMELDVLRGMEALLRRCRPKLVVEFHRGVEREPLLDLLESAGYHRQATAIEPRPEHVGRLLDDHSYVFHRTAL